MSLKQPKLSPQDRKFVAAQGISTKLIAKQIQHLQRGSPLIPIVRQADLEDGIQNIDHDSDRLRRIGEHFIQTKKVEKFVPASGAASRMFRDLHGWLNGKNFSRKKIESFSINLIKFPFFPILRKKFPDCTRARHEPEILQKIIRYLLSPEGLNYGQFPKALIPFHRYRIEGRTPLEEQIVEGINYVKDGQNRVRLHFTLAQDSEAFIKKFVDSAVRRYERKYKVRLYIRFSLQEPSTQTIAIDEQGRLFRTPDRSLLLRPGGHGALLRNLDGLNADYVFIKNIDNVVKDSLKPLMTNYKKAMLGYLAEHQLKIFSILKEIKDRSNRTIDIQGIIKYIQDNLCIQIDTNVILQSSLRTKQLLFNLLNRPIRVCGMIAAGGPVGGGPFWVKQESLTTLQIIEDAQLSPLQKKRFLKKSKFFHPADIVCGIRNFEGKKFNLKKYVDSETVIITEKNWQGHRLKCFEYPGLWNGGMGRWISLFVETPREIFAPVKEINDLLLPAHQ